LNTIKCRRYYVDTTSDNNANGPVYNQGSSAYIAVAFAPDPDVSESVDCNYNLFFSKSARIWYVHCVDFNSVPLKNIRVKGWVYVIPYVYVV